MSENNASMLMIDKTTVSETTTTQNSCQKPSEVKFEARARRSKLSANKRKRFSTGKGKQKKGSTIEPSTEKKKSDSTISKVDSTKPKSGSKKRKSKEARRQAAIAAGYDEETIKVLEKHNHELYEPGKVIDGAMGSYTIIRLLGAGAFGAVYKVADSNKEVFAMKFESRQKVDKASARLKIEALTMNCIHQQKSAWNYLVHLVDMGRELRRNSHFNFIVMPLIGPSLDSVKRKFTKNRKFSIPTIVKILIETLKGIRDFHDLGFLHRDIKIANCAIGNSMDTAHRIYLFDYGMARYFRNKRGKVRKPRRKPNSGGTVLYMSRNCHLGKELCRKDDLESWLYVAIELLVPKRLSNIMKLPDPQSQPEECLKIKESILKEAMTVSSYLSQVRHKTKKDVGPIPNVVKPLYIENRDRRGKLIRTAKRKAVTMDELRKRWKRFPMSLFLVMQKILNLNYYDRPDYEDMIMLLHVPDKALNYTVKTPFDWLTEPNKSKLEDFFKQVNEKDTLAIHTVKRVDVLEDSASEQSSASTVSVSKAIRSEVTNKETSENPTKTSAKNDKGKLEYSEKTSRDVSVREKI